MKHVLVTGASGGIGRACALAFAGKGYSVTVCYNTNKYAAEELTGTILKKGVPAIAVKADVSSESDVAELFKYAESEIGPVDTLINNAGISHFGLLTDMSTSQWHDIINTNLTSVFLCCRQALPSMVKYKRGCIINMSSIWGESGASCESAYSASKAGMIGLSKALAKEYGPSGIRVNCISPGFIATGMNSRLSQSEIDDFTSETPLCRTGTPDEVASAALFLAENGFVTGQVIGVTGGL